MCNKCINSYPAFSLFRSRSDALYIIAIVLGIIGLVGSIRPAEVVEPARVVVVDEGVNEGDSGNKYSVEGRVMVQQASDMEWVPNTRVVVDGGQYLGILKSDGSFTISNIPSGSYVVEVIHPRYVFDATRVEINSKGKIRARALNNIQPSAVHGVNYPLKLKARGLTQYFYSREQWKITDFLYSPMVMMMVLPLLMMFVLPKLMNSQDPETQREMQQSMNMLQPKQNLPDLSEWLTQKLSGASGSQSSASGGAAKKAGKPKAIKKQQ